MLFQYPQSDIFFFLDKQHNDTLSNLQVMEETKLLEGNLAEV
jgi:hypothetical protein